MSPVKEPQFFNDWNWHRGLAWYEAQFPASAKVVGESSPTYTVHPAHPHVPERMASVVPDAKLIYLVRDPIERLVSGYRFRRWILEREDRPLDEALADFETSTHVVASCYAMQLEQLFPYYPLERILVLEQRALAERRIETLRRAFRFLEVDESLSRTGVRSELQRDRRAACKRGRAKGNRPARLDARPAAQRACEDACTRLRDATAPDTASGPGRGAARRPARAARGLHQAGHRTAPRLHGRVLCRLVHVGERRTKQARVSVRARADAPARSVTRRLRSASAPVMGPVRGLARGALAVSGSGPAAFAARLVTAARALTRGFATEPYGLGDASRPGGPSATPARCVTRPATEPCRAR